MLNRKYYIFIGIVVCLLLAAAPAVYFYRQYQALKNTTVVEQSAEELVAKAGKHILLPIGETPTVMTVTDREKLSGQLFFANGKNGDKVLIYEKAKKAILYDPVADKVIEVGPIAISSPSPSVSPAVSPVPTVSTPSAVPKIIIQ